MPGGMTQIKTYGYPDLYTTNTPEITFFKRVYKRHTNFASEELPLKFDGLADFGKDATVAFPRHGDLVWRVWLQVTVPNLYDYVPVSPGRTDMVTEDVTARADGRVKSTTKAFVNGQTVPLGNNRRKWFLDRTLAYDAVADTGNTSGLITLGYTVGDVAYADEALTQEILTWPYYVKTGEGVSLSYSLPTWRMRWCNSLGYSLVESVELEVGGQKIDRYVPEWSDMMDELAGSEGTRPGMWEMLGKYADDEPVETGGRFRRMAGSRTLYIPVHFTFAKNKHHSMALPLVALSYHVAKLNVRFRPYLGCIASTVPLTRLESKRGGSEPCLTDATVFAEFVFLESTERRNFATRPHEYLIEQTQLLNDEVVLANMSGRKIALTFSQPVKELVFVYTATRFTDANQYFRYGMADGVGAQSSVSPIKDAKILLNGADRLSTRPGDYFRLVQPYMYHSRTPRKHVYVYSFALNPEDVQASGACNFSRVDSAHLTLTFAPGIPAGRLRIFAKSYNLFRIQGGMAGLAFNAG